MLGDVAAGGTGTEVRAGTTFRRERRGEPGSAPNASGTPRPIFLSNPPRPQHIVRGMVAPGNRHQPAEKGRRPMLMTLVYGVFLVLIGVTASALVAVASLHVSTAMLDTGIAQDRATVELFVNGELRLADLDPATQTGARRAAINRALADLTGYGEILRMDLRALDGTILASSEPGASGSRTAIDAGMSRALAGEPVPELLGNAPDLPGVEGADRGVVQEYLPVYRTAQGQPAAVIALWRDAAPILGRIDAARRDIVIVTLAAAGLLAVLLFLLFRAAQGRLTRQQAQLLEAERRDPLTNLLNHGALVDLLTTRLDRSQKRGRSVGIALIDVDNFRLFNETHGHHSGDQLLLRVAEHLGGAIGADDDLGRYGPDEYLLIRAGTDDTALASDLEAICAGLRDEAVQVGDSELPITVSAGIAVSPQHATSVTDLLSVAAVAAREARASGGDAVRVAPGEPAKADVSGSFNVYSGLVLAIDTKDRYTKRHSEDVARYAVFLASRMGLDDETRDTIRLAGLLHDIGKIGIPDDLLRKPGKLLASEFDIFQQHVALGDAIVRDLPDIDRVREGVRFHHERWDGHGYLEGLEGGEIPLIGRVLAVADSFSAMTTSRPYRKALSVEEALKRLGDAAGSQLEEELVKLFIDGIETDAEAPLPGEAHPALWRPLERVA